MTVALTSRLFLLRVALAAVIVLLCTVVARAGGPKYIAGTSYFDPTVTGQPLTWIRGSLLYYTDQGDLSPALPNASANNFVAAAFNQWASVPTAALSPTRAGQLAEDVNGTNVFHNADGTISVPLDIQSTATSTPIGVVFDSNGSVTDALLGTGASSECFTNAVFGGSDNYGTLATYRHALIILNGLCAQQPAQLPDLQYRLMRLIGNILGLGWSQANLNVLTGNPHPTSDDYAGFPLMHFLDPLNCTPITLCYANAPQLSPDDGAAIARLYPVTAQNQSSFPGKQVLAASTARIHGSVWFTDTPGNHTQPMQGVNVVARWIDPATGQPSRRYVVTSVSGFLFTGNEGNPITGTDDAIGEPLDEWGSDNPSLEGFFDLAGLPLPSGNTAQYQLSTESLDSRWSAGVGPYSPGPVSPSGSFQPITITVSAGSDVQQDILMRNTAQPLTHPTSSWAAPAQLPPSGDWISSLSNFDEVDYFSLSAQTNRTLSISVTALDEFGRPTLFKAQPVIGMWSASDPPGTSPPAFTPSPFNQSISALTRLDTQVLTGGNFVIGLSDVRGDARPDYRYHARVLYADSISPSRISVIGAPITIKGVGFAPGIAASVGSRAATVLSLGSSQIVLSSPPSSDGSQSITISDPASGGSTTMTNVLQYGASASDNIVRLSGLSISTAVGTATSDPVVVRVLAADGVTPVNGATIGWTATNGTHLSVCGGAASCIVTSDAGGYAYTWATPAAAGSSTITATLAPGVYSPPKSVVVTLTGTQLPLDIGPLTTNLWISKGQNASVPLTVRAVSNGSPFANTQVHFTIESGTATLTATNLQTDSNGYATATLTVTQISALVQVSACMAAANTRCATFCVNPISIAQQRVQPISGAGQISTTAPFQPVVVRVTDLSSPPNPIIAAPVAFQVIVLRPGGSAPSGGNGETNAGNPAMPVILSVNQTAATTDLNGIASIIPSSDRFSPPLEVDILASGGNGGLLDFPLQLLPAAVSSSTSGSTNSLPGIELPARVLRDTRDAR
jgi:hypothetical protein